MSNYSNAEYLKRIERHKKREQYLKNCRQRQIRQENEHEKKERLWWQQYNRASKKDKIMMLEEKNNQKLFRFFG